MSEYLHGAYGEISAVGTPTAINSQSAFVVVGTAPVGQIRDGHKNVNKPILVKNLAEARKYFGYSGDWAKYTLCEAFHVFFEMVGYGPLVVINVLNTGTGGHRADTATTASLTPSNGKITIASAEDVILDTITLTRTVNEDTTTFKEDTDYTLEYDFARKAVTINVLSGGGIGTSAVTVSYYAADPSDVDDTDVIGSTNGMGTNTGLYAVKDVYGRTGMIPAVLLCPGFGGDPAVHSVMYDVSRNVNGHWNMYMYTDIPLTHNNTAITMETAKTWKGTNGYNKSNEKTFFPMVAGTDNKKYHLSTLAAALLLQITSENDDIPYHSSSNIPCPIIENLYLGADAADTLYDDEIINENLNKEGISSAAFVGGRWVIWGAHSASYNATDGDNFSASETNAMMLYYLSNDFQYRRTQDVDQPLTANDIATIRSEEQARIDALVQIGALSYGVVETDASADLRSDLINGDHAFTFNVTTVPLARSLKVHVNWVDTGFETYFETGEGE